MNTVNLNRLLYLKALLTERHVSRAAQKVGLSQPGMSQALKELRIIFRDPLLVRGKKGYTPTEKALYILGHLETGFESLEKAIRDQEAFSPQHEQRQFRIMCTDYVSVVLIPELCKTLQEHYPGITLELLPWNSIKNISMFETVDLIIGFYPNQPPRLFYEQLLFEENYLCMIRNNHPRIKDSLTLEQFLKEDHVIVREQDGAIGVVDQALEKLGITRRIVLEISSFLAFPFTIAKTDLVITTTSRNIKVFASLLPIRAVPNPLKLPSVPVKQLWHSRTHNSPAHQWLRGLIYDISQNI